MEEGKHFFKLDGPIGRKQYILVILLFIAYSVFTSIAITLFHVFVKINKYNLILFIILWGLFIVPMLYITWINRVKRFWDLIGDKTNAIFYISAIFIADIATAFIPVIKFIWPVFSLAFSCLLLFKKGKLVAQNTDSKDAV